MARATLLFDLDGTLLDTLEDLYLAVNQALEAFGLPLRTRAQVRAFVGNGAARLMQLAMPGREDDPPLERILPVFKEIYDRICRDHTCPYPGIPEALQRLQQLGYPMAVVSNKPDTAVKELCRVHFEPYITVARGDVDGVPRKPAPDMPVAAAAALGAAPENCIYIGDSEVDVLTARNAAMTCLTVTWGFRDEPQLLSAGAEHLLREPERLPEKIQELEELLLGK